VRNARGCRIRAYNWGAKGQTGFAEEVQAAQAKSSAERPNLVAQSGDGAGRMPIVGQERPTEPVE